MRELIPIKGISREQWLSHRRRGIGGSEVAAILGISRWKSPLQVWQDKTGRAEPEPENSAMYWGSIHEDTVAKEFAKRTGRAVWRCNHMIVDGHSIGDLDRLICIDGKRPLVGNEFRTDAILECKTANEYAKPEWGPEETDDIPDYYITQCLPYLGLTGVPTCRLAVLIGGNDFRTYTIHRDEDLIAHMKEEVERFWHDHVEADVPPAPRSSEDVALLFPRSASREILASAEIELDARALLAVKERLCALEDEKTTLEERIKLAMGEYDTLVLPGGEVLATWKSNRDSVKTDWKNVVTALSESIAAGMPEMLPVIKEIVAKNTNNTPGARPFKLK